ADHVGGSAFFPDLQLLDGGGAKRVGGAEQHGAAFGLVSLGELADRGGLPRPVHADHDDDRRRLADVHGRPFGSLENFEQMLLNQAAQLGGVADLISADALSDALEDLGGGLHSDIGADEGILEL